MTYTVEFGQHSGDGGVDWSVISQHATRQAAEVAMSACKASRPHPWGCTFRVRAAKPKATACEGRPT